MRGCSVYNKPRENFIRKIFFKRQENLLQQPYIQKWAVKKLEEVYYNYDDELSVPI